MGSTSLCSPSVDTMEAKTLGLAPTYFKKTFSDIRNEEKIIQSKGLEVICAGLPRTGTLSLKAALTHLLGGRCYHGFDTLFGSYEDVKFWTKVSKDTATDEEIRDFFTSRGCTAAADFPAAFFYKKLMKVFPTAKLVLTTRSPISWQKSMKESLYLAYCNRTQWPWRWSLFTIDWRFMQGLDELYDIMDAVWLDAVLGEENKATDFFEEWEQDVKDTVPEEKLLVFKACDGWKLLCNFLEMEIPDGPYPRLNNTQQFQEGHKRFRLVTCIIIGLLMTVLVGFFCVFISAIYG